MRIALPSTPGATGFQNSPAGPGAFTPGGRPFAGAPQPPLSVIEESLLQLPASSDAAPFHYGTATAPNGSEDLFGDLDFSFDNFIDFEGDISTDAAAPS